MALERERLIVFDVGNVVALGDEKICRALLYSCGVSFVNTSEIYSCSDYYDFLRGKINPQEFHDALVSKHLHHPVTYEQIHRAFKLTLYAVDQGVVDILSRLNRQSLAFLTDTNVWQEERLSELIDLNSFSDKIFKSHETGMVKIDKGCFPLVLSRLGVNLDDPSDADRVTLIDDSSEKVEMAKKYGLRTFQFVNSRSLLDYLRSERCL